MKSSSVKKNPFSLPPELVEKLVCFLDKQSIFSLSRTSKKASDFEAQFLPHLKIKKIFFNPKKGGVWFIDSEGTVGFFADELFSGERFKSIAKPQSISGLIGVTKIVFTPNGLTVFCLTEKGQVFMLGRSFSCEPKYDKKIMVFGEELRNKEYLKQEDEYGFIFIKQPLLISQLREVKDIGTGEDVLYVLLSSGKVLKYGYNQYARAAQLSFSSADLNFQEVVCRVPPIKLKKAKYLVELIVESISVGSNHLFCVTQNGFVYAYGSNETHQLDDSAQFAYSSPELMKDLLPYRVEKIFCGSWQSFFIIREKTGKQEILGRGENYAEQLGGNKSLRAVKQESNKVPFQIKEIFSFNAFTVYVGEQGKIAYSGYLVTKENSSEQPYHAANITILELPDFFAKHHLTHSITQVGVSVINFDEVKFHFLAGKYNYYYNCRLTPNGWGAVAKYDLLANLPVTKQISTSPSSMQEVNSPPQSQNSQEHKCF